MYSSKYSLRTDLPMSLRSTNLSELTPLQTEQLAAAASDKRAALNCVGGEYLLPQSLVRGYSERELTNL